MENKARFQYSESRSVFQRLYGRLLYAAFESLLWNSWFQRRCLITGDLPDAPFVMVSNHSSYLDWLFLDVILRRNFRRKIIFLAKRKVVQNPVWGVLAKERRAVVVDELTKLKAVVLAVRIFRNCDPASKQIVGVFLKAREAAQATKFQVRLVLRGWQESAAWSLFRWHCAAFVKHGHRNEDSLDSENRVLLFIS